jgi:uncharacterized protein (DUF736 family)
MLMRKRIIQQDSQDVPFGVDDWMDLERIARVEVTSEEPDYPVEAALIPGAGSSWRASQPGEQVIRLLFDDPQKLKRICMVFDEEKQERTQEFVLLWSADGGRTYREVVRQQFNFSPPTTSREVEDYRVDLEGANALELRIVPHTSGGPAVASLTQLRLA